MVYKNRTYIQSFDHKLHINNRKGWKYVNIYFIIDSVPA